jgi:DNA end-binding protein Ku
MAGTIPKAEMACRSAFRSDFREEVHAMPQAIWTGQLAFGLVNVPVKLVNALAPRDVRFHQFERDTGRRVRYQRIVESPPPADEPAPPAEEPPAREETGLRSVDRPPEPTRETASQVTKEPDAVPWEDIVKGFEIEPGRVVTVTPDELAELAPARSRSIEVEQFVDLADIDPIYFEKSYYAVPQAGAERAYTLLVRAQADAGKVAVGRFVLRTREHLAALRSANDVLVLHTMFFADEVREPRQLWSPPIEEPSDREMQMARQLIEVMAGEWDASRFRDEYRERVLELLQSKSDQAFMVSEQEEEPAVGRVVGLMEALKASVEAAKRAREERAEAN